METILLFAPLVGAIICGFSWRLIGEAAACWTATILLFLSCLLSWVTFLGFEGETYTRDLFTWIASGTLDTSWSVRIDRLTAIMLIVITTVSALVHLYSFGYMAHDEHFREGESYRPRFFAYLSFFTFAMLSLVTADNLLQLFFGWEGVGVASYLLIGFYFRKPTAGAAAMKAFIVNRVGDFAFLLGIFAIYKLTDSINFSVIMAEGPHLAEQTISFMGRELNAANTIGMLLFIGAMGKSAQLFLHTWLPDAMEGPTPVSALIHAATMVTAGVFLVCRMSPIMEYAPDASNFIIIIGADDGVLRRDRGSGAERHQARDRLFDLFAAGLHVRGGRRRGLFGGDVPPADARLLQGDAVPRRGLGHPLDAPRTGHAELWRSAQEDPLYLLRP